MYCSTEVLYHMARKKASEDRTRNWSFILYPESAPEDWRDILNDLHIAWVESPLHDRDVSADGSPKKPHVHVLLLFDGVKTYEQVCSIIEPLNVTIPQRVQSAKGLVRYMAHLDDPNKAQYAVSDIVGHGGADVAELLKPTSSSRYALIREMSDFVRQNGITEYYQLYFYAMDNRYDDWFPLLCDSATYALNALIKSLRHSGHAPVVDNETGEVLHHRQ